MVFFITYLRVFPSLKVLVLLAFYRIFLIHKFKPMFKWISFLFIFAFCLSSRPLAAQFKRFQIGPKSYRLKLKAEYSLSSGVSWALGPFAQLEDRADLARGAGYGAFVEGRIQFRSSQHPIWIPQIQLGYMQLGQQTTAWKEQYNLLEAKAQDWSSLYLMPGLSVQAGRCLQFQLRLNAGAFVLWGWNAQRGILNINEQLDRYSWSFSPAVGGAIELGASLQYRLNEKWTLFTDCSYFSGRSGREGIRRHQLIALDSQQVALHPPLFELDELFLQRVDWVSLKLSIGLRYRAFKHLHNPNRRYWNYY